MANISHIYYPFAYLLLVVLVACSSNADKGEQGNPDITYSILGSDESGYSYQIFISQKLFIDQYEIPAVGGRQKFKSSAQAELVAKFVISKLTENDELPSVSTYELDSLGIIYNKIPQR